MANNKYKKAICVWEVTCDYPFLITYIDLDSGGCTVVVHLPHHTTIEGLGPAAAAGTSGKKWQKLNFHVCLRGYLQITTSKYVH